MRIEDDDSEDEIDKIESDNEEFKKRQRKQRQIIIIVIFLNIFLIGFSIFLFFWRNINIYSTKPQVVEPKNNYSNCIIFLHGLNDSAEHFKEFFEKINFKKKNSTKLIFIPAPKRKIENNNMKQETEMNDIYWTPKNSSKSDNFEETTISRDILKEIINKEAKLLNGNYSKIIIGGHYQGDCLSLYKGYTVDYHLGGVISLCGELFEQVNINENNNKLNENDKIIPFSYYKKTVKKIPNYEGISKDNYPEVNYFANNTFTQLASNLTNFLDRIL
jgi:predicted esterase